MSSISINFFARTLNFRTEVRAVLPEYPSQRDSSVSRKAAYDPDLLFPVVYLLHGFTGDYSDWSGMVPIERYAQEYGFAVIIPHGYNSWYRNVPHGPKVEEYIADELPAAMEAMLPISTKSEDRFIAGLSMGGTGAIYTALKHPARYRAIGSASAVFSLEELVRQYRHGTPDDLEMLDRTQYIYGTEPDICQLYTDLIASGATIPRHLCLYGLQDEMLPFQYRTFETFVKESGAPVTMRVRPGGHDFSVWDPGIREILEWFSTIRNTNPDGGNH